MLYTRILFEFLLFMIMSSLSVQTIPKEQCQKDLFEKVQEFQDSALSIVHGDGADPARGANEALSAANTQWLETNAFGILCCLKIETIEKDENGILNETPFFIEKTRNIQNSFCRLTNGKSMDKESVKNVEDEAKKLVENLDIDKNIFQSLRKIVEGEFHNNANKEKMEKMMEHLVKKVGIFFAGIKANNMVTTGFNDRISNDHHALPFVLSRRGKREGGNQPVGCIVLGLSAFVAAVTGALEIAKVFPGGVIAIAICFGAAVLCLILMICACNWLK